MAFADWLKSAQEGLADSLKRYNNSEFLDAVVAGCALVAAADGSIDSEEKQKMLGFMKINDAMKCFDQGTIAKKFNSFAEQLEFDVGVGKEACHAAIKPIAGDDDKATLLVRVCCAIGGADGDFDDDEKNIVREICGLLGLDVKKFQL